MKLVLGGVVGFILVVSLYFLLVGIEGEAVWFMAGWVIFSIFAFVTVLTFFFKDLSDLTKTEWGLSRKSLLLYFFLYTVITLFSIVTDTP